MALKKVSITVEGQGSEGQDAVWRLLEHIAAALERGPEPATSPKRTVEADR